jgi:hypothetical protein
MKKLLLSFGVLLLAVLSGFSQATLKPSLGFSFNNFSETNTGDFQGKVGVQLGASVAFGKKVYVEPGIFYVGKAAEFSSTSGMSNPVTDDLVIRGLRVPVAVGVGVLGNEETFASLRAFGGASGFFVTGVGDALDKDDIASPTWGVFAGAGVDFWIMFAELSYEWSVTEAGTIRRPSALDNIDIGKSRTLFLTLGLKF